MPRTALSLHGPGSLQGLPNLDRLLQDEFNGNRWGADINVEEHDDHAVLRLDVPGVRPEQINVSVEHRTLTIQVEREGRGSFTRQYTIGAKFDLNAMKASLEYGVLTLQLPKGAEAQARKIPIEVG